MDNYIFNVLLLALLIIFQLSVDRFSKSHKNKVIINFLLLLEGLSLLFFYPWFPRFFSFLIIVSSLFYINKNYNSFFSATGEFSNNYKISSFLKSYSKLIGFVIVLLVVVSEYTFGDNKIATRSQILLLTSIVWILFNNVPSRFYFEKNFTLLFMSLFSFIYIFPFLVYKYVLQIEEFYSTFLIEFFLIGPLENFLNLIGYTVWARDDILYFEDNNAGIISSVKIAFECSGLYSTMIFISAFISYNFCQHNRFDFNFYLFMAVGIFLAYISNILRMSIIVIVGHYFGIEALTFVHTNLGWLIFIIWIFIFWKLWAFIEYKDKKSDSKYH